MTSLSSVSRCHECSALLPDNGDDRRAHLGHHKDIAKKIEAQRQRIGALSADVLRLVDVVKTFRRTLDSHPINAEPTEIEINDIPDDEIGEYEDDLDDAYAGEPDEDATATGTPDGRIQEFIIDADQNLAYPAIDRDDDLDTRLANATNGTDLT